MYKWSGWPSKFDPSLLRKYVILLESPMLVDTRYYKVISHLFQQLSSLPESGIQYLKTRYIPRMSSEKWKQFYKKMNDYLSWTFMRSNRTERHHNNKCLHQAVIIISWIWEDNKIRNIFKTPNFYNEVVSEYLSSKDAFLNWMKQNFSFCNYPYILTPEKKSKILAVESWLSQQRKREDSMFLLQRGVLDLPVLVIKVRRDHLIEDSVDSLLVAKMNDISDLTKPLKVKFEGEDGIDEGGVKKEWFQLLVSEIFSPKYGMFIPNHETRMHFFNPHSTDLPEFELLGQVLGLAIYNGVILDLHFPDLVYKKLCNVPVGLEDLKEIHPEVYRSLKAIEAYNEPDFEEAFMITFQISYDYYGSPQTYDLLPGGDEIPVSLECKDLFKDLYVKYLLEDSVKQQFDSFEKGFRDVCKGQAMSLFEPEELHLLICGSPELDFTELEKTTVYDNGYDKEHPTIRAFWEVVHELSMEEKKQLLSFTTGSDRSPIGGLGKLSLVISKHGDDSDRLPTSHTCFNHFFLPAYKSKEKLKDLLTKAIANSTGFGLI
eukprot:TRINITY_DN3582_c0_g1_i12.p1 TRINITY_DN3582_c0_g1~~TRINITY_DN3582_c0_g1_i12.p1  ORF type:complete len:544 (+),score=109.97 TRINITY_DN3582_c0_g1_i12:586-2217(+)